MRRFGVLGWLFLLVACGSLWLRYERMQDEHHRVEHRR
jgi:hypothetical protein